MREIENFKANIIMCLINTEENKGILKNVPNRSFQDLSVIYRLVVEQTREKTFSTVVNNELAKHVGMTEEELFQCAVENTRRMNPVVITSMENMFLSMLGGEEISSDLEEMMMNKREPFNMWIISNSTGIYGATSMLYEENLHQLAERMGSDLYIIPSSIHEVLALSTEIGSAEGLADMVHEVNMNHVMPKDRLSNNVYHYDKDLRKLTMATDVKDKRLSGGRDDALSEPEKDRTERGERHGGR